MKKMKLAMFLFMGLAVTACVLSVGVPRLWGQGTAYITGRVTDASDAVVPGATVVVKNEATGVSFTVKTTTSGIYRSPTLTPGNYNVSVIKSGFQKSVTTGVSVLVGSATAENVILKVGTVTQSVEVKAGAPLLTTTNAGLGQNVTYSQVAKLPYFSRSAGVLLALAPAVRFGGENLVSYGGSRYNVGGMTNVNVMIDGANVGGDRLDVDQMVINPSVEALKEVKVTESQYSARYGRDIGGLVQMETKSGTNAFHGGIYEYFRNDALDTYNAFSRTKPTDRQHMFGGSLGGPIKKDKLFFFTTLEIQKSRSPVGILLTVPTAQERNGDFTALTRPLYDPSTTATVSGVTTRSTCGVEVCNNIINPNYIDSVASNALKYIPLPTLPGTSGNLPGSAGNSLSLYRGVNRIDWNISDKDRLSGVWMFTHMVHKNLGIDAFNKINIAASPQPTFAPGGFGYKYFTEVYNFHETHIFSPTFFMSNRVTYRPRYISRVNPAVDPSAHWAETLGIKNYAGARLPASYGGDLGFPTFNFSGYTSLGPGMLLFQEHPIRVATWNIDLTFIQGKHTITTGFSTEYGEHGVPNQTQPTGLFNFGPLETGLPGQSNSGDPFASFLLGLVNNANTQLGPLLVWHNWYSAAYIEDDWKVLPNLTLNLGFRWNVDGPVYEKDYRGNGFDFYQINPVSGTPGVVKFLNRPDYPYKGFYNTDWHRFNPRFGFAWQVLPKTVIRGGYGLYSIAPNLGTNPQSPSLGFTTNASFSSPDGGITPAFILQNGFPNYPLGGDITALTDSFGAVPVGQTPNVSPTFVPRRWKFGYSQNFDLSVERKLPWDMVFEVAGQGTLGRNLPISQNWNEVAPQFWGMSGANFARRPFPQFGNVTEVKSQKGTTDYYEGYVRLNKSFSNGLTLIANYSYGRSLGFMGGSMYYPNLSRGPVVYNTANGATAIPYQLSTISWVYELPWGEGQRWLSSGLAAKLFGNWSVGGILTMVGGTPFTITSGGDSLNGNSPLGNRINLVGDPHVANPTYDHWFNTNAFAPPQFGQIGSYHGFLLGPANQRLDLSIRKSIRIREHLNFSLVGEFFNFTNTPQYGPPDSIYNTPNFGRSLGPDLGGLGNVQTPGPFGARIV